MDKRHFVVVYHDCCLDGLASAWVYHKKYGHYKDVHLDYIGYAHHDTETFETAVMKLAHQHPAAELHFVDVAPKIHLLEQLDGRTIRVIDHHKSAYDHLAGYKQQKVSIEIDPNHPSAAHMVWERLLPDVKEPAFFSLIAKMDVAHDLHTPEDFAAAAFIDSKDIKNVKAAFSSFEMLEKMDFTELANQGTFIHHDQFNRIGKLADNIMFTKVPGFNGLEHRWVPVVNADVQNFGRYISEYLRDMGKKTGSDISFAWFMQGSGSITMSIRSDGTPDANAVAAHLREQLGVKGGGHKTSAAVHFDSLSHFAMHMRLFSREDVLTHDKNAPETHTLEGPIPRMPRKRKEKNEE